MMILNSSNDRFPAATPGDVPVVFFHMLGIMPGKGIGE